MVIMTDEEDDPDDGDEKRKSMRKGSTMRIMILERRRTLRATLGKEWPPDRMGSI